MEAEWQITAKKFGEKWNFSNCVGWETCSDTKTTRYICYLYSISYENKYMKTKDNKNFIILIKKFI